jgi:hypothetical protein
MLKSYVGNHGVVANSSIKKSIAIVGMSIFNNELYEITAKVKLFDMFDKTKSNILETQIASKETLFLDTKIFLSNGDKLYVEGADFTLAGSEDDI